MHKPIAKTGSHKTRAAKSTRSGAEQLYKFKLGRKSFALTFEQAFTYGHTLLEGGHARQAAGLFQLLAKVGNRGPRAAIMLARCQADLNDFAACHELLEQAFAGEQEAVAKEFQTAFVYYKLGMKDDAAREMSRIVKEYANLPTACLVLGDWFAAAGNVDKARKCWKLAVARDRRGGSVGRTARKQLAAMEGKPRVRTSARPGRVAKP
ncbi:MAG: tetratricopeptide repeat protein [Pirellulales bacterium]